MDADQARDFVVPRVAAQAERDRAPLTTTELQTLMFEDVDLPDNSAIYEAKLASLISRTSKQLPATDIDTWNEAVEILEAEGTYLSLLLIASRSVVDWKRVRRIALYAILIAIAVNYLTIYASRWID